MSSKKLNVGGFVCEMTCTMESSGIPWECKAKRHICDQIPVDMHVERTDNLGWEVTDHEQEGMTVWGIKACPYCGGRLV